MLGRGGLRQQRSLGRRRLARRLLGEKRTEGLELRGLQLVIRLDHRDLVPFARIQHLTPPGLARRGCCLRWLHDGLGPRQPRAGLDHVHLRRLAGGLGQGLGDRSLGCDGRGLHLAGLGHSHRCLGCCRDGSFARGDQRGRPILVPLNNPSPQRVHHIPRHHGLLLRVLALSLQSHQRYQQMPGRCLVSRCVRCAETGVNLLGQPG
mmetsp:Transcript_32199/g.70575  ORF Transcript_32199/g.70575 Transcript_32199/m.70575 type:complete len:206 (-) Transcript_32199:715-1332(-)